MTTDQDSALRRFGAPAGRPVIYLHGTPGAPVEAELAAQAAMAAGVELLALDRAAIAPAAEGDAYLHAVARRIDELADGEPLPILGFSIGASVALRVASRLGDRAGPLLLLSTAGPLDAPGAFDGMGGGAQVFRAAQRRSLVFEMGAGVQGLLAAAAPDLLRELLFSGAEPSDQAFAASREGKRALREILRQSLAARRGAYRRDVTTYVEPWSDELASIRSKVALWHGANDTWAPVAMARTVAERCGGALTVTPGGHYTTLRDHVAAALATLAG